MKKKFILFSPWLLKSPGNVVLGASLLLGCSDVSDSAFAR